MAVEDQNGIHTLDVANGSWGRIITQESTQRLAIEDSGVFFELDFGVVKPGIKKKRGLVLKMVKIFGVEIRATTS